MDFIKQKMMNSMDEICVPVIKKILGHYLELNPNYSNENITNHPIDGTSHNDSKCSGIQSSRKV